MKYGAQATRYAQQCVRVTLTVFAHLLCWLLIFSHVSLYEGVLSIHMRAHVHVPVNDRSCMHGCAETQ